jgi:hypothetical protein
MRVDFWCTTLVPGAKLMQKFITLHEEAKKKGWWQFLK